MRKYFKVIFIVGVSLVAIYLLFSFTKSPIFNIQIFDKEIINYYASLQSGTILISLIFLLVLYFTADRIRLNYLNLRCINAPMQPVTIMGIKQGEQWRFAGRNIAIVITIVTTIIVYFQVAGNGIRVRLFPDIPLVLLFSLMNSFTEEVIFRLSYTTIVANQGLSPRVSEILGAAIFGIVHYFGLAPRGIAGALMAAFIGWFLAKSINETKGFFWAWLVHFVQDVVILFLLFSAV